MGKPVVKLRPSSDRAWWTRTTAPLLAWLRSGGPRTWEQIHAWAHASRLTSTNAENQVSYLDIAGEIENVAAPGAAPLWRAVIAAERAAS